MNFAQVPSYMPSSPLGVYRPLIVCFTYCILKIYILCIESLSYVNSL